MALKEVCIAARDMAGRIRAGDIICVRTPRGEIGSREDKDFIWVLLHETDIPRPDALLGGRSRFRYRLPLGALQALLPEIDLRRLTCSKDRYQPFFDLEPGSQGSVANKFAGMRRFIEDKDLV